jgi:OmpA family protein
MSTPNSVFYKGFHTNLVYGFPWRYATIYFAFAKSHLDASAVSALDALVHWFSPILAANRVIFTFVGRTDHVGGDGYNMDLGQRRAEAVKAYVETRLGRFAHYSGTTAMSLGEKQAATGSPSRPQMALDRNAEVYGTWAPPSGPTRPTPTPAIKYPDVRRTTHRSFAKFKTEPVTGSPDPGRDLFNEGLDAFLPLVRGGMAKFEYTWGDEEQQNRRVQVVPANYRVNLVKLRLSYSYNPKPFVIIHRYGAEIDYVWGPPLSHVLVHEHKKVLNIEETSTKVVLRQVVDNVPLLTPPDPK